MKQFNIDSLAFFFFDLGSWLYYLDSTVQRFNNSTIQRFKHSGSASTRTSTKPQATFQQVTSSSPAEL